MRFTTRFHDRLTSAAIALALQAGLVALLVFSLTVVRHVVAERETIITLNRVLPPPMVIDARGPAKPLPPPPPAAAESSAPEAPSVPATPPATAAAPATGPATAPTGQAQADCTPSNLIGVAATLRIPCPPPVDPHAFVPQSRVKDEAYWEAERAKSRAPMKLPGAGSPLGPLGILLTALFNPSAFADKRNYQPGPPLPPKDGAAPDPQAPPPHVSDDAFRKALQAVNARKRAATSVTPTAAGEQR